MPLDIWADDDALYSSGGNGPLTGERPPVSVTVSKYRGPGTVTVPTPAKFTALKGGKPMEPYSGKASTTATFSEPGDYLLHVTANDYSGNGGGGSGCCWTTVDLQGGGEGRGRKPAGSRRRWHRPVQPRKHEAKIRTDRRHGAHREHGALPFFLRDLSELCG